MQQSFTATILERIAPEFGARVEREPAWGYAGRVVFSDQRAMQFMGCHLDVNPLGAAAIAGDKTYALWALAQAGLPVPEGEAFFSRAWARTMGSDRTPDAALAYARSLGFPLFVKPNSGCGGADVHCVGDTAAFVTAVRRIIRHDRVFRVERPVGARSAQSFCRHCESAKQSHTLQHIVAGEIACVPEHASPSHSPPAEWETRSRTRDDDRTIQPRDLRLVVVGDTVACAYERTPLTVVGDGRATIADLIRTKRAVAKRMDGRPINLQQRDSRVLARLARIGCTLEDVPAAGEHVQLLDNANLSSGGDARDITDALDPALADLAVRATRALGLAFAGVDVIASDFSPSIMEGSRVHKQQQLLAVVRDETGVAMSSPRDRGALIKRGWHATNAPPSLTPPPGGKGRSHATILELNAAPSLAHYAACGPQQRARAEECYRRVLALVGGEAWRFVADLDTIPPVCHSTNVAALGR